MKNVILLILCLSIFSVSDCRGGELVVYQDASNTIHGHLPNSWASMKEDEISSFVSNKEQLISEKMQILAGYRLTTTENISAMLFVFYANPQERVSWEQRQKMFGWFKGDRTLMSGLLPDNMKDLTLENIEYLQNKDTVIFETKVKVDGTELNGVNGIVFLQKGYLDIVGYVSNGSTQQLNDFYSFIKTLEVSPSLQYTQKQISFLDDYKWFQQHWQQVLGVFIFVLVYGITFLHSDKNKLTT